MIDSQKLAQNLAVVRTRIDEAMRQAGRQDAITLVAVTKGQPAQVISDLLELGVNNIGESYVDEALEKRAHFADPAGVSWHMIGHIQSRKAKDVATNFQLVHSVDSLKLAERLSRAAGLAGDIVNVLLECNIGAEVSKHGWAVSDKKELAVFFADVEKVLQLPNLKPLGLMSMAPVVQNQYQARPFFAQTHALRDELEKRFPSERWDQLSMGMSDDFEAAILEGSTFLRIGTALVGSRVQEA